MYLKIRCTLYGGTWIFIAHSCLLFVWRKFCDLFLLLFSLEQTEKSTVFFSFIFATFIYCFSHFTPPPHPFFAEPLLGVGASPHTLLSRSSSLSKQAFLGSLLVDPTDSKQDTRTTQNRPLLSPFPIRYANYAKRQHPSFVTIASIVSPSYRCKMATYRHVL